MQISSHFLLQRPSKSWQIWLLLCLRIATVVKWEKEMKDFWLQIAKPSIHLSLLEKIYKPFSGWKCWKNQTGSLIGLWFTFMWEFGNTCTAWCFVFPDKRNKKFWGTKSIQNDGSWRKEGWCWDFLTRNCKNVRWTSFFYFFPSSSSSAKKEKVFFTLVVSCPASSFQLRALMLKVKKSDCFF